MPNGILSRDAHCCTVGQCAVFDLDSVSSSLQLSAQGFLVPQPLHLVELDNLRIPQGCRLFLRQTPPTSSPKNISRAQSSNGRVHCAMLAEGTPCPARSSLRIRTPVFTSVATQACTPSHVCFASASVPSCSPFCFDRSPTITGHDLSQQRGELQRAR